MVHGGTGRLAPFRDQGSDTARTPRHAGNRGAVKPIATTVPAVLPIPGLAPICPDSPGDAKRGTRFTRFGESINRSPRDTSCVLRSHGHLTRNWGGFFLENEPVDFTSTPAEQASTPGTHDSPDEHSPSFGTFPRDAPICVDSLLDRCMQDPGFALVLLSELENSAPELVELLADQVEAGDAAGAAESLHKLKGATGIVCANHLCELARSGEVAGRDGDHQQLKSLIPEIRKGWDKCREFLPTLRDRLS